MNLLPNIIHELALLRESAFRRQIRNKKILKSIWSKTQKINLFCSEQFNSMKLKWIDMYRSRNMCGRKFSPRGHSCRRGSQPRSSSPHGLLPLPALHHARECSTPRPKSKPIPRVVSVYRKILLARTKSSVREVSSEAATIDLLCALPCVCTHVWMYVRADVQKYIKP